MELRAALSGGSVWSRKSTICVLKWAFHWGLLYNNLVCVFFVYKFCFFGFSIILIFLVVIFGMVLFFGEIEKNCTVNCYLCREN